jgi:undecaprenyl-diphosphatase
MSISELNIDIFRWINDLGKQYPSLNPVSVFFAEYTVYVLGLAMIIYWFTRVEKNRMMVIQGGVAFILAEIMGKLVGQLHVHYQPFAVLPDVNQLIGKEINNSFPSDHTILFFSICVSFWLVRKKEGWLWLVLACCVGISRILVGVHYPVDIATSIVLSIVAALVAYWIIPRLMFIKRLLAYYEKVEQRILPVRNKSRDF